MNFHPIRVSVLLLAACGPDTPANEPNATDTPPDLPTTPPDTDPTDTDPTDTGPTIPPPSACSNDLDDDSDGWIDDSDPGCTNDADDDEGGFDPTYECNDGLDNDADGLTDATDPNCGTAKEGEPAPLVVGSMRLLPIAAGTFEMGCTPEQEATGVCDLNEFPVHTVTFAHDLWMAETEMTQGQYVALTGVNPASHYSCDSCPVERTNWHEAVAYCNALSLSEGLALCYDCAGPTCVAVADLTTCAGYRLPTEAEWEFAARCGDAFVYAGSDDADAVAWTEVTAAGQTHKVAQKTPNRCGLYDMSGNVSEWTNDYMSDEYESGALVDPLGALSGYNRAHRGGSYIFDPTNARVAVRGAAGPFFTYDSLGFRVVRTIPQAE